MPLVVDGRTRTLHGVLDYTAPGAVWAWIAVAVLLAAAAAFAALRLPAALPPLALAATAAVWAIRLGRELYGRPTVPVAGWIEIALTCAVGALFVFGLTRPDAGTRIVTAFFVGIGALYEVLTMLPLLTHAVSLNALPSSVARALEVVAIATGAGALAGSVVRPALVEETGLNEAGRGSSYAAR